MQNHPKPDLKLILQPRKIFVTFFSPVYRAGPVHVISALETFLKSWTQHAWLSLIPQVGTGPELAKVV